MQEKRIEFTIGSTFHCSLSVSVHGEEKKSLGPLKSAEDAGALYTVLGHFYPALGQQHLTDHFAFCPLEDEEHFKRQTIQRRFNFYIWPQNSLLEF